MTTASITHYIQPLVLTPVVGGAVSDYEHDIAVTALPLTLHTPLMAASALQPLWDFSNPQMTFDDPRYTFDGLFALPPVTPPVTPPVGPPPPPTPNLRVEAVSAGWYNGDYYVPGDVFDLLNSADFSDSTKNIQPSGAEWAPGWMKSVASTTPLYQALSAQPYPTAPAVDAARRFVL